MNRNPMSGSNSPSGFGGANVLNSFKPQPMTSEEYSFTNRVYINKSRFDSMFPASRESNFNVNYVRIQNKYVLSTEGISAIPDGCIALSRSQREWMGIGTVGAENIKVDIYEAEALMLSSITLIVDTFKANTQASADAGDVISKFKELYGQQYLSIGQPLVMNYSPINLRFQVKDMKFSEDSRSQTSQYGIFSQLTNIVLVRAENSRLDIETNGPMFTPSIFKDGWDFESMGIGGLDAEFKDIFRRAFTSRLLPPSLVAKLGVPHVRGMLLYGPPGTGKTLIARQIGKMLNGREPKVVSGPSILDKYVGGSENNIRMLFREAEIEQKQRGENSGLHIIILDELDAICKTRGTRGGDSGVGDSVVNQLLAMIDGVESLNNILVIGMTNRKEMIDEALLRPGRLEVHVEISLPNEEGREQIFRIHTAKMTKSGVLDSSVDLKTYAKVTKNYSGSEIEGVVKAAASYTFARQIDPKNLANLEIKAENIKVSNEDFLNAIQEVKPAFGAVEDQYENYAHNGIVNYGPAFERVKKQGQIFVDQVKKSERTPLVSILLHGEPGSGKSSIATYFAKESEFPFVRIVSPHDMIGLTETAKVARITKAFEDSYKTPLSCIIVDDLERLIEFVPIGPRFSNLILQALLVLLKRTPPKGHRLLVLTTTSNTRILRDMDLHHCFASQIETPNITSPSELKIILQELGSFSEKEAEKSAQTFSQSIPIKQLIMAVEIARQEGGNSSHNLNEILLEFGLRNL